jgi:hypothetical protein
MAVAPVAEVADAPPAVIGPDHPAAARVIIVGVVVVIVGRPDEEAAVKAMVSEPEPAVANAAAENMSCTKRPAMERWSGAEPAVDCGPTTSDGSAMKRRAAAMECAASAAVEGSTSVTAAATMATTAVATATVAGDFDGRCAGSSFRRRQRARINQRQSFGTMRSGRQHQHRGREGNASHQATDGTA